MKDEKDLKAKGHGQANLILSPSSFILTSWLALLPLGKNCFELGSEIFLSLGYLFQDRFIQVLEEWWRWIRNPLWFESQHCGLGSFFASGHF